MKKLIEKFLVRYVSNLNSPNKLELLKYETCKYTVNIPKDRLKRKQQKRYLKNEIKFSDSTLKEDLNICNQYKLALELNYDHIAEGIRIRTKSTKFFLNLEKQHW